MTLLEVNGLMKTFGAKTAVDRLTFAIPEGRCVALLGPNGAGKTTTLNMLSGLLAPSGGTIRFRGASAGEDLRGRIGYLPQQASFYPWMTGREYLRFAGRLARLSKRDSEERAEALLRRVGLHEARNRRIGGYSGGMKQRLGLAQALIHRPSLVILDEPVSALDPIGRRDVLDMLKQLKQESTILFSTHVLHDAEEVCDDVLMISEGKLVLEGTLKDIRRQHRKPLLIIREDEAGALKPWAETWGRREDVKESSYDHGTVRLAVDSPEETRYALLQDIAANRLPIRSFELGHTTLEDLFMKAVGNQ